MNELDILKKKILYRSSYRGTKEMDLLLSKFTKHYLDILDFKDLLELEKFLNIEDELIYNYYQNNTKNNTIKETKISKLLKDFKI
jgi:antitoxin CptB